MSSRGGVAEVRSHRTSYRGSMGLRSGCLNRLAGGDFAVSRPGSRARGQRLGTGRTITGRITSEMVLSPGAMSRLRSETPLCHAIQPQRRIVVTGRDTRRAVGQVTRIDATSTARPSVVTPRTIQLRLPDPIAVIPGHQFNENNTNQVVTTHSEPSQRQSNRSLTPPTKWWCFKFWWGEQHAGYSPKVNVLQ